MSTRGIKSRKPDQVTFIEDIPDDDHIQYTQDPRAMSMYGAQVIQDPMMKPPKMPEVYQNMNCVDIAYHNKYCPVCSQLYSSDKTPYNIAIVVLLIIVILLTKRVLECR